MTRFVRAGASVTPWLVHAVFAASWGVAGYAAGFPFFLVMAIAWSGLLVVFRKVTTTETLRSKRIVFDVLWIVVAFVAAWEGGFAIVPALACFVLADLIDPSTPIFPIALPRKMVVGVLVVAAVVVIPIALTAPLYESARSVAVGPGATPAPEVRTTTRLVDVLVQPTGLTVLATLALLGVAAAAVTIRSRNRM